MNESNKKIIGIDGEVILREFNERDLHKLAEYANNKNVSVNLREGFPNPYTMEDSLKFFEMVKIQKQKTFFAIEYKGEYVGNIGLSIGTDIYRKSAEIGYFIGEPFWNKGIATKAVNLITTYGFDKLDITRIYTGVFDYNKSSQRVLEKCGFEKEAVFKNALCKNDKIYNEVRYARIKRNINAF